jgi:ATP-binding cassette subfamily F protein uup
MEALQADIERLGQSLADPELFARDPAAFDTAAAALKQTEADLAAAEEDWLALEIKREEIEGS